MTCFDARTDICRVDASCEDGLLKRHTSYYVRAVLFTSVNSAVLRQQAGWLRSKRLCEVAGTPVKSPRHAAAWQPGRSLPLCLAAERPDVPLQAWSEPRTVGAAGSPQTRPLPACAAHSSW